MSRTSAEFRHVTGADIPGFDAIHDEAKAAWHAMMCRPSSLFIDKRQAARDAMRAALAVAYRAAETAAERVPAPVAPPQPPPPPTGLTLHYAIRHPNGQISYYRHQEAVARQDFRELRESDPTYAGRLVCYAVGAFQDID